MRFEPKILALCCHYCAYAAADLAGSMRLTYPPNVRVLRLPCTGKVDMAYIMRAFERGVDGVIVAGCLEGGCHFQEGNLRAKKRVGLAKQVLEEAGFDSRRLEMFQPVLGPGPDFCRDRGDDDPKSEGTRAKPAARGRGGGGVINGGDPIIHR